MRKLALTVLPGDGIGPEVTVATLAVLEAVGKKFGFTWQFTHGLIGLHALEATGRSLPVETLRACRANRAVLLGPVAGGKHAQTVPSNQPRQAVLKLRDWLGSYAAIRPIRSFAGLTKHGRPHPPFNLAVVLDYSSGLYFGRPRSLVPSEAGVTATNTMVYTSGEVSRVLRVACQLAEQRQKRVLSVDQRKWLETGQLWASTVAQDAVLYPAITIDRQDAGHFLYDLVNQPDAFDVIACEMSLGLLISSVAQGLSGAFAMHPVAYVGGETSVFQPSHGSGPHIVGQGSADPIGMIRTGALALDLAFEEHEAARAIELAVDRTLEAGPLPAEIGQVGFRASPGGAPEAANCQSLTASIIRHLVQPIKEDAAATHSGDRPGL